MYSLFAINQKNYSYYLYFAQGIQFAFVMCLLITAYKAIVSKNYENTYIRIAIFGVLIFLLLWENRSRYLLNYIPIFIVIIIEFFYNLKLTNSKILWKRKKDK